MKFAYSIIVILLTAITLSAQPSTITYQGKLLDGSGNPETNPGMSMEFRIYNASSGGALIWGPETKSVNVQSGMYTVYLGETSPLAASDFSGTEDRYLEVIVGSTTLPRTKLRVVPYAFKALSLTDGAWASPGAVGSTTPSTGVFTNLTANTSFTSGNVNISGGTIDGTIIGASTPSTGSFTSLWANNGLTITSGTVSLSPGGTAGTNGQVFTSNASGNASWQNPIAATGWALTGNTGAGNFLGSTDAQPLSIITNNTEKVRITTNGQIEVFNTGNSVFIGEGAGVNDDLSDNWNVFIGYQAGNANTTGYENTANGCQALYSNLTGYENTANGYQALYSNIGESNTANGCQALYSNLTGWANTANGYQALYSNTGGAQNTANGYFALYSNTSGEENTAIGMYALYSNKTLNRSTAIGYGAMYYADDRVTGGDTYNTAVGYEALKGSTTPANNTGQKNTAIGDRALYSNTSGDDNTACGVDALYLNTTGYENTACGVDALYLNTTGFYNTAIGRAANVSPGSLTFSTAIGYNATVNASNKVRIGDVNVTVIEGQVAWSSPSDGRFKFNVAEEVKGLEFIAKLRPVTYRFDTKKFNEFLMKNMPDSIRSQRTKDTDYAPSTGITHTGFIAQEVEQAAKECGFAFDGVIAPKDEDGNYSVAYSQFVVPLVKGMQELYNKIQQLESKLEQRDTKIVELVSKLDKLNTKVDELLDNFKIGAVANK